MSQKTSTDQWPVFGTLQTQATVTASFNGTPTSLKKLDNVAYQFNITGALVGSVNIQTSNDYLENSDRSVQFAGNWVTLPLSYAQAINGTGSGVFEFNASAETWIRPVFTYASGSGTMNIIINAKSGL